MSRYAHRRYALSTHRHRASAIAKAENEVRGKLDDRVMRSGRTLELCDIRQGGRRLPVAALHRRSAAMPHLRVRPPRASPRRWCRWRVGWPIETQWPARLTAFFHFLASQSHDSSHDTSLRYPRRLELRSSSLCYYLLGGERVEKLSSLGYLPLCGTRRWFS